MEELTCYFNGSYIRGSEVKISLMDDGLWRGAIYDVGRSYNHVPIFWEQNIDRLYRSLRYVHIDPKLTPEEMLSISHEVFKRNERNLDPADDFIIMWWVSPGAPTYQYFDPTQATVLIICHHLSPRYKDFAKLYQEGSHLVVANARQLPPQCLDAKVKHTNRWCNRLAEFEAKMVDPEARALMLDINGMVAEGPTFSCFMVKDGRLFTPKLGNILAGITRGTILKLAKELGIESAEKDLYVYDLYNADEIFTTATGSVSPVAKFNERVLPKPIPGPITQQLISAFNKLVGVDLVQRVVADVQAKEKTIK